MHNRTGINGVLPVRTEVRCIQVGNVMACQQDRAAVMGRQVDGDAVRAFRDGEAIITRRGRMR